VTINPSSPATTPAASEVPARPFRGSGTHATVMLVVVTFLWGFSFPLVKNWMNAAEGTDCPGGQTVATFTLLGLRTGMALIVLAVFEPRLFLRPTWREHSIGAFIGLLNFAGSGLQVLGLGATSPALSAFFTCLGSAWVPILGLLFFRAWVAPLTLAGLGLAVAGAGALSGVGPGTDWTLGWGEQLTIWASIIFAVMIVLLDRFGQNVRPGHITVSFLAATGLPALLLTGGSVAVGPGVTAWLGWTRTMLAGPRILGDIAFLTIGCTVLAFHWFIVYQPRVPATRAALIYLLEPVFASILSILWGHDQPSLRLALGGGLIIFGNLLVELPGWLKSRRQPVPPVEALAGGGGIG
jgi:drug/metabolite transporter (DMT)-like permease